MESSPFTILGIRSEKGVTVLDAVSDGDSAACPTCGVRSRAVHERYVRRPRDLPWRGGTVRLHLQVRRFRCHHGGCPRRTFAEDLSPTLRRYARWTAAAEDALRRHALTTSGEAAARLMRGLGLPTSGDTLLRLVRRTCPPTAPTPKVLGVDEFAFHRRRRFATLLVDLEQRRPIDLLEGHGAEPLATWLQQHPGVDVLVRDRGGAYADGGRVGAAGAVQVADRFHLLHNASGALDEVLRGRRRRIEHATVHAELPPATPPALPEPPPSLAQRRATALRERQVQRWQTVQQQHAAGVSISQIAREHGMNRRTVRLLLRTPEPPPPVRIPRPGGLTSPLLQPFVSYLQDRWQAGCTNFAQLTREIRALGYTGSGSLVSQALLPWRPPRVTLPRKPGQRTAGRRRIRRFSVRWLCLRPREQLDADEDAALQQVLDEDPHVARGYTLLQRFRRLVRERQVQELDGWLEAAAASELSPFVSLVRGLREDRAAVDAALTQPWSNGPVEGHVTRVKLLKRIGYGRAKNG